MPKKSHATSAEVLVLSSRVKSVIRDAGMRSDSGFVDALSLKVHAMIQDAIVQAKSNKRSTLRPHDLG